MVKGTKKAPRKNRLLGFSGTPTDEELDEFIDVYARLMFRLITSEQFLEVVKNLQRLQETFARFSSNLGDA